MFLSFQNIGKNNDFRKKIQLEEFIIKNWTQINRFIDREMSQYHIPFYSSVDIRESKEINSRRLIIISTQQGFQ